MLLQTQHIQEALASCGWKDAQLLEQQDTSEAFAFITETLQLPLLTLQVDLYHQGKGDKDDHKLVYERLLNLAIPPDPDGKGIKLEDCLEEYFNNQVDVFRDSLEEKHKVDSPLSNPRSTIRIVTAEDDSEADDQMVTSPVQIEGSPLARRLTLQTPETPVSSGSGSPPALRHRSTSVIQRIVLDEKGRPEEADSVSLIKKAKQTGSTVVKAVTIPAWQFFRLIRKPEALLPYHGHPMLMYRQHGTPPLTRNPRVMSTLFGISTSDLSLGYASKDTP